MDIEGPAGLLTDLVGRIAAARSNRPRLGVRIILYRGDMARQRLIFRASVLNYGRVAASDSHGFWTIFTPDLEELSSGRSVFWSPANDEDYDFQDRRFTSAAVEYNERRFCWAELVITESPVAGTNIRLFPYDHPAGRYTFALLVEYGQYKSFDFVGLDLPARIRPKTPVNDAIHTLGVSWSRRRWVGGFLRSRRLARFVAKTDYHNYVRPT